MGGGGRKIHCDFCGISYPANAEARRTHNKGSRHRSLRAKFYEDIQRTAPKINRRKNETASSVNLAAAYWVTEHLETCVGSRMLLRPRMSHQRSTVISPTGSSQGSNATYALCTKRAYDVSDYRREMRLQSHSQGTPHSMATGSSRDSTLTCQLIGPSIPEAQDLAAHDSVMSAPPTSLMLDGDPADIRTDWAL